MILRQYKQRQSIQMGVDSYDEFNMDKQNTQTGINSFSWSLNPKTDIMGERNYLIHVTNDLNDPGLKYLA